MAMYIAQNQGLNSDYDMRSGDPMLGVSKSWRTLGKTTIGSSAGVRRDGLGHLLHPETTVLAPTIRVIHIFAPKIIKTDVANFRSTVQRLTGRPRKASTGRPQRRARTKTVFAPSTAAVSSPDSSGFQETDHHQLLSRQNMSTPARDLRIATIAGMSSEQDSPVRCNAFETDSYSLTSNSMDSTFSFYSSVDSRTSNQDQLLHNQGSMHSPDQSDGSSFFSHRQAPYSLNEIPAPFFSGSDFLQSTTNFIPANSTTQDYTSTATTAACAAAEFTSKDNLMPLSSVPPLDFNGMAGGFSDLDNIFTGLGSTLPDLPLNFPPLSSSSNGLFYDSIFMAASVV